MVDPNPSTDFSNEALLGYCHGAMKRYLWCDLASAILDALSAIYAVRGVNVTGKCKEYVSFFALLYRAYFATKILIHVLVIPVITFSGSLIRAKILMEDGENDQLNDTRESFKHSQAGKMLMETTASNILMSNWNRKITVFSKVFFALYLTALALITDHSISRMFDITLMTLWVSAGSFGTFIHFIYFPDLTKLGEDQGPPFQHPKLSSLIFLYCALMVAGWTVGNYIAILDWDEPFMHFPNANYVGLCLGHLAAVLASKIWINV